MALVREAAEQAIASADERDPNDRNYVQMARATLVSLDWLEGRQDCAPSTGKPRPAGDVGLELSDSEDMLHASQRPGNAAEFYWHNGVWGALAWYRDPSSGPAITVPGINAPGERST